MTILWLDDEGTVSEAGWDKLKARYIVTDAEKKRADFIDRLGRKYGTGAAAVPQRENDHGEEAEAD
jgi:hypothetical protein